MKVIKVEHGWKRKGNGKSEMKEEKKMRIDIQKHKKEGGKGK